MKQKWEVKILSGLLALTPLKVGKVEVRLQIGLSLFRQGGIITSQPPIIGVTGNVRYPQLSVETGASPPSLAFTKEGLWRLLHQSTRIIERALKLTRKKGNKLSSLGVMS